MSQQNVFEEESEWVCSYYKAIDLERLFRYLRMCTSVMKEFKTPRVLELLIATACLLEPHKVEACINTFFEETDSSRHSLPIFLTISTAVFKVAGFHPDRLRLKRNVDNNKKNRQDSRLRIQLTVMKKECMKRGSQMIHGKFIRNAQKGNAFVDDNEFLDMGEIELACVSETTIYERLDIFYEAYGNREILSIQEIDENCTMFETSGQIRFYDALVKCAHTFNKQLGVCLTNDLSSESLKKICDKAKEHGRVAQLYNALRIETAKLSVSSSRRNDEPVAAEKTQNSPPPIRKDEKGMSEYSN